MRQIAIFLVCLMGFTSFAYGQYHYNAYMNEGPAPGGLNEDNVFPYDGGGPGDWEILSELNGVMTPEWSDAVSLPFTVEFNGEEYDEVRISNAGIVTFTEEPGDAPEFDNHMLPHEDVPDNSVCVLGITPDWEGGDEYARVGMKTFGEAPNRQHWISFNSYGVETASDNAFVVFSVMFDERTNDIYILDQRGGNVDAMAVSLGLQFGADEAYVVDGSPNIPSRSSVSGDNENNTYYKFVQGERPAHDVNLRELYAPTYFSMEAGGIVFEADIRNFGAEDLSSVVVSYTANDADPVAEIVAIDDLGTNEQTQIVHPTEWVPEESGDYTIEFSLSEPNEEEDANPDDNSASTSVLVAEDLPERKALVETFTSATCPPCRPGNINLENAFDNIPDQYVSLRYQVNWPGAGDPYFTSEIDRRWNQVYNDVTGVPSTSIDGAEPVNPASFQNVGDLQALIEEASDIHGLIEISGTAEANHIQQVSYEIEIEPYVDMPAGQIFHLAIAEKRTENNVMTNGETEFFNVMKKMIPNEGGTELGELTRGEVITQEGMYEFQGDYRLPANAAPHNRIDHSIEHSVEDFANLEIIAFVQDPETRRVHQAFRTDVEGLVSMDEEPLPEHAMQLYPNPASGQVNIAFDGMQEADVTITNMQGAVMHHSRADFENGNNTVAFDTQDFAPGMYIVNITNNQHSVNESFIVR